MTDHYIPTYKFDALVNTLLNLPAHLDRRTQIIELLLGVGVAPMCCLADRDAAEMAQANMAYIRLNIVQPISQADAAALDTYEATLAGYYAEQIELAKAENINAA